MSVKASNSPVAASTVPPAALATRPALGPVNGCRICEHNEMARINVELARGEALKEISRRAGMARGTVSLEHHLAHWPTLRGQRDRALGYIERTALEQIRDLQMRVEQQLVALEQAKDLDSRDTFLKAMGVAHQLMRTQAELLGELDAGPKVNVLLLDLGVDEDFVRRAVSVMRQAPREPEQVIERALRVLRDYALRFPEEFSRAQGRIGAIPENVVVLNGSPLA